jgi:hypothetical protein
MTTTVQMTNPNAENTQHNTHDISQPVKRKKGPSTPEAKERVKYNALRHGFTGQVLIMTPEEREKFDAFVKGMMTDLAPAGTHETFLANSIAEEAWRLNQIRARCANLSVAGELALMSLYGQRTQRAYEKYKRDLNELQEKRKAGQASELEEARLLFQLADTQGLAYDPKKDGFVFSVQFIRTQAERHHRLILAKRTQGDYWKTRAAGKAA